VINNFFFMQNIFKTKKAKIIGGVVAGLIALIVIVSLVRNHESNQEIFTVGRSDVTERVEVAGTVESQGFAELGFEVGGRVSAVLVDIGDVVRAGQTLMRLDTAELRADLLDAQAQVEIERANLENDQVNLADVRQQQDVLVETARRTMLSDDLEAVSSSLSETLTPPVISGTYTGQAGRYRVRIERGTNSERYVANVYELERTTSNLEDNKSVPLGTKGLFIDFDGDIVEYLNTTWLIDIPNTRSASYTANLNAYEQALENRTVALRDAERSLQEGGRETSIAEAELQQAQARVNRIQAQINQRVIRSPFAGTITAVEIEPGEITTAGNVVVAVVSGGGFEIEVEVPEIDISKLEVGNSVEIDLDAFGGQVVLPGEIVAISQAETLVDGVPVYETRVIFKEDDPRIRSGMTATVSVLTESKENIIAIPREYIQRDGDGRFVSFVASAEGDDIVTERRGVQLGLEGFDGLIEIISGLNEGDLITKPMSLGR
jgi:HlyD family secretion protein